MNLWQMYSMQKSRLAGCCIRTSRCVQSQRSGWQSGCTKCGRAIWADRCWPALRTGPSAAVEVPGFNNASFVSLRSKDTCNLRMDAEILPRAQSKRQNLRRPLARPQKILVAVVYQLLQLHQHLLHLRHRSSAVDELADLWMRKLVGSDQ